MFCLVRMVLLHLCPGTWCYKQTGSPRSIVLLSWASTFLQAIFCQLSFRPLYCSIFQSLAFSTCPSHDTLSSSKITFLNESDRSTILGQSVVPQVEAENIICFFYLKKIHSHAQRTCTT